MRVHAPESFGHLGHLQKETRTSGQGNSPIERGSYEQSHGEMWANRRRVNERNVVKSKDRDGLEVVGLGIYIPRMMAGQISFLYSENLCCSPDVLLRRRTAPQKCCSPDPVCTPRARRLDHHEILGDFPSILESISHPEDKVPHHVSSMPGRDWSAWSGMDTMASSRRSFWAIG